MPGRSRKRSQFIVATAAVLAMTLSASAGAGSGSESPLPLRLVHGNLTGAASAAGSHLPTSRQTLGQGDVAVFLVHDSPSTQIAADGVSPDRHRIIRWASDGLYSRPADLRRARIQASSRHAGAYVRLAYAAERRRRLDAALLWRWSGTPGYRLLGECARAGDRR